MKRRKVSLLFAITIAALSLHVSHAESSPPTGFSTGDEDPSRAGTELAPKAFVRKSTSAAGASLQNGIHIHVTPNPTGTLYPDYRNNMMTALGSRLSNVGTGPSAFTVLVDNAIITPEQATLLFFNSSGWQVEGALIHQNNTQKFSLADVQYEVVSRGANGEVLPVLKTVGDFSDSTYNITRRMIDFTDQVEGNGNDRTIASGPATQQGNRLEYRGVAVFFNGTSAVTADEIRAYVARVGPITTTFEYRIAGQTVYRKSVVISSGQTQPPPTPVINSFTVSASTVASGANVTVHWNVSPANTLVSVSNIGSNLEAVGGRTIQIFQTTTFTLSVPGLAPESRTVTAVPSQPAAPTITFFTADRTSLTAGESTVLRWSSVNATSASIPGVGSSLPATGQATVTPSATTAYTLTVFGPSGTATAPMVTVTVTPVQPQVNLALTADLLANGAVLPVGSVVVHNVFPGAHLELKGEIRNAGSANTSFTGVWQYRLVRRIVVNGVAGWQIVQDWTPWVGDGIATTAIPLTPGSVHNTGYEWRPIAPEERFAYQFRLSVRTGDGKDFMSAETAAIAVVQGATGQSTAQAVIKLIPVFSGEPGVYAFQRSTDLVTWTTIREFDTRSGVPLVFLPENAFAGPMGFFRAVRLQ